MDYKPTLMENIRNFPDIQKYKDLNWEGSFEDYLEIVRSNPKVARSAFQRVYDMIVSQGTEEFKEYKKNIVHYKFFEDPFENGKDAIYGLDLHIMKLVHLLKSAAKSYGAEKRIFLLHGPVGSSKSTIARLLKKGVEQYSRSPEGALYTFEWVQGTESDMKSIFGSAESFPCPMHEEPLRLVPQKFRKDVLDRINEGIDGFEKIDVLGDLCPSCRYIFNQLHHRYQGNWSKVIDNHIRVKRLLLSENDRIGIGTFQPKDEKKSRFYRTYRGHQLPEDRRIRQ